WDASWISLALTGPNATYLVVWNRSDAEPGTTLLLNRRVSCTTGLRVETVFPTDLPAWPVSWDAGAGRLRVTNPTGAIGARVFRISSDVGSDVRFATQ
ncbi:MAG: hypothetical protein VB036_10780, partial [Propionicimonas sp.]|nr:hypothetical protein [Propionicimonas sp.]